MVIASRLRPLNQKDDIMSQGDWHRWSNDNGYWESLFQTVQSDDFLCELEIWFQNMTYVSVLCFLYMNLRATHVTVVVGRNGW